MRMSITLLTILASLGTANLPKEIPCKTYGERCGGVGYGDCCEELTCTVSAVITTNTAIASSILTHLSILGAQRFS